jgi:hypothetical protein
VEDPLDVAIQQVEVECSRSSPFLKASAHDLHVLLRHRPRSISGVGEVASLPPAPEKPRRLRLREAEKGDYRNHKRDNQDDAEGVHLPQ